MNGRGAEARRLAKPLCRDKRDGAAARRKAPAARFRPRATGQNTWDSWRVSRMARMAKKLIAAAEAM